MTAATAGHLPVRARRRAPGCQSSTIHERVHAAAAKDGVVELNSLSISVIGGCFRSAPGGGSVHAQFATHRHFRPVSSPGPDRHLTDSLRAARACLSTDGQYADGHRLASFFTRSRVCKPRETRSVAPDDDTEAGAPPGSRPRSRIGSIAPAGVEQLSLAGGARVVYDGGATIHPIRRETPHVPTPCDRPLRQCAVRVPAPLHTADNWAC